MNAQAQAKDEATVNAIATGFVHGWWVYMQLRDYSQSIKCMVESFDPAILETPTGTETVTIRDEEAAESKVVEFKDIIEASLSPLTVDVPPVV